LIVGSKFDSNTHFFLYLIPYRTFSMFGF